MIASPVEGAPAVAAAVTGRPGFDLVLWRARCLSGEPAPGPPPAAADAPPLAWSPIAPRPDVGPAPRTSPEQVVDLAAALRNDASARPVELTLSRDVAVKLSRSDAGVAIVVEATPLRIVHAEAELPRIVHALRARGIAVAAATARMARGGTGGSRPR